jgi:hypothetical protein
MFCCSLEGGNGGRSLVGAGALSPRGPKGPKESSTACRRTGWAPARRGVRPCRPAGDLMGWEDDEGSRDVSRPGVFDVDSISPQYISSDHWTDLERRTILSSEY